MEDLYYLDPDGLLYLWHRLKDIFAEKEDIPTKLSELTNDPNFQTDNDVMGLIAQAIGGLSIPSKTSDLTNDSDFQTGTEVDSAIGTAIQAANIPEKTSDLTNDSDFQTGNDVDTAISEAISGISTPVYLSDLTNDMTFQTLSQITTLINNAIGEAVGLKFEVVQTLPATGESGTIYLVPNGSALIANVYNEYVYYNNSWELIGNTTVDLTNYIQKGSTYQGNKVLMTDTSGNAVTGDTTDTELEYLHGVTSPIQTQINGKANSGDVPTSLSDLTSDATHRLTTDTEKATWNGKADSSDIPTALSELTDDATHRLVTDTEKIIWNGKADSSDIPTDLADLTADSTHRTVTDAEKTAWNDKANVEDIPTKTSDLTNDSGFATTTDLSGKEDSFRFLTMPTASADNVGDIVQFIGTTTASYTTGYFYKCVEESGSYSWVQTDVQPSSGGGGASESEIAPVEATSTASKAYAVGDLLIYNGHLYRVTTAIASGGTITPNTNCVETSVSEVFVRKTGDTMSGALSIGTYRQSLGLYAFTHGSDNIATGQYAHAEGSSTAATKGSTHAEGVGTTASGIASHAECYATTASGDYSHSEGYSSSAEGYASHVEGTSNHATGRNSHASGEHVTAGYTNQFAIGFYNDNKDKNIFEVGYGSNYETIVRKNILELEKSGNLIVDGTITDGYGNTLSGTNSNIATVENSTTASQAYAIGDYLVYGGQLYKVTAAIAQGGTITISGAGANVAATTVIEAINDNTFELLASEESDLSSSKKAYVIGDYITNNGLLYKVIENIEIEDSIVVGSNILLTTIGSELSGKNGIVYGNVDLIKNENDLPDDINYILCN